MIVERLDGTVGDLRGASGLHVERVRLSARDRDRSVQRVTTDHGTTLGLRLPRGTVLADGDILYRDDKLIVIVASETTPVIIIRAHTALELGRIAHALGNRHLPAQFGQSDGRVEMIVPDDHTVADFLMHHQVPFERTERLLDIPFRHAEHRH